MVEPNIHALPKKLDGLCTLATLEAALASAEVLVMLVDHNQFKAVSGDSVTGVYRRHQRSVAVRTILVTGGAGFIGSAVVREIIQHTADRVVVVDKRPTPAMSLAPVAQDARSPLNRWISATAPSWIAFSSASTGYGDAGGGKPCRSFD